MSHTVVKAWKRDRRGEVQECHFMSTGHIPAGYGFSRDPGNVPDYTGPYPSPPAKIAPVTQVEPVEAVSEPEPLPPPPEPEPAPEAPRARKAKK